MIMSSLISVDIRRCWAWEVEKEKIARPLWLAILSVLASISVLVSWVVWLECHVPSKYTTWTCTLAAPLLAVDRSSALTRPIHCSGVDRLMCFPSTRSFKGVCAGMAFAYCMIEVLKAVISGRAPVDGTVEVLRARRRWWWGWSRRCQQTFARCKTEFMALWMFCGQSWKCQEKLPGS